MFSTVSRRNLNGLFQMFLGAALDALVPKSNVARRYEASRNKESAVSISRTGLVKVIKIRFHSQKESVNFAA